MTSGRSVPYAEELFEREQGAALARRSRVALGVTIAIHLLNLPTNDAQLVGHPRAAVLRGAMIVTCLLGLWWLRSPRTRGPLERGVGLVWASQLVGLGVMQWLSPDESLEAWSGVFVFGTMVLSMACGYGGALTAFLVSAGLISQIAVLSARLGHPSDLLLSVPVIVAIIAAARSREALARAEVSSRAALATLHEENLRAQRAGFVAELHDGPAASVARAAALLERARREGGEQEALAAARHGLGEALAEARALMNDLDQTPATWSELVAEVRRELRDACEAADLGCRFEASADREEAPSAELAHAVRRTLREAATNIIRHAHASELAVSLVRGDGEVRLEVRDDGRGPGEARPGRGLAILMDRARRLGGDAELAPAAGGGAVLRARLPEPREDVLKPSP